MFIKVFTISRQGPLHGALRVLPLGRAMLGVPRWSQDAAGIPHGDRRAVALRKTNTGADGTNAAYLILIWGQRRRGIKIDIKTNVQTGV